MNLIRLPGGEENPIYEEMAVANLARHYGFLWSVIQAAVKVGTCDVSHSLVKALNSHAVAALHDTAGAYRPGPVTVAGQNFPPPAEQVESLMSSLISELNAKNALEVDASAVAAYALWRINRIHPFENGNGRTARAVCFYILCVRSGGWFPGRAILPEVMRREPTYSEYIAALQKADNGDLDPLTGMVRFLLVQQITDTLS